MLDATVHRASVRLAATSSRRSFLGRLGAGVVALVGGPIVAVALDPSTAQAHHICGHTYTTGSCPHPFAPLSRIDRAGYPVHPRYGYPVDDLGRIYTSRDQRRRKICEEVVRKRFPKTGHAVLQGGWSRCCHGQIRRIVDCCSYAHTRINGDASLTGYCYGGRKVFCITYRDTNIPC